MQEFAARFAAEALGLILASGFLAWRLYRLDRGLEALGKRLAALEAGAGRDAAHELRVHKPHNRREGNPL